MTVTIQGNVPGDVVEYLSIKFGVPKKYFAVEKKVEGLTMDDVDFWSRFGEAEAWVNLEGGLYRLSINGEAVARQGDLNTGADLGFWFALSFEIP